MPKIRILQCVYSMDCGGVESWLMHVLRNIDRKRYQFDFLYHSVAPSYHDEEIWQKDCAIYHCPYLSKPWRYRWELRSILKQHGPFDAVHSHDVTWNGPVLEEARLAGIPVRIAHSHNDIAKSMPKDLMRRLFTERSRQKSKKFATDGLSCSDLAATSYFGEDWNRDPRWRVFFCGENFSEYHKQINRPELRRSLGIAPDAYVIGHVGSFRNEQKNHSFIVDIANQYVGHDPNVVFLLVGDGDLREKIEQEAVQAGFRKNIRFVGVRSDVPELLLGAMDLFLFPSLYEGLGLAVVEAQAAGLPCICSDVIPKEADVVPELITRISLSQSPKKWAAVIKNLRNSTPAVSCGDALATVEKSRFDLRNSIDDLMKIYSEYPNQNG